MKKIILTLLIISLCFFFAMCDAQLIESAELPIEKNIDAVAEYLGCADGKELSISWKEEGEGAGAKAGKTFHSKYGEVTIYEFDPNSNMYKFWENNNSACVEGFVIWFDDEMTDYEFMQVCEKIENIKFIEDKRES